MTTGETKRKTNKAKNVIEFCMNRVRETRDEIEREMKTAMNAQLSADRVNRFQLNRHK